MLLQFLVLTAGLAAAPASSGEQVATEPAASAEEPAVEPRHRAGRGYLSREVARSYHLLDHGVLAPEIAVGTPHVYRVGLRLGLFDHLTLGATIHWLPGAKIPAWSPQIAVAFYRGRILEVGAHYSRILYPPPVADLDPATISFQRRADLLVGSLSLSQAWFTGGFDLGWARGLEVDPLPDSGDEFNQTPVLRDRLAVGLHLRVGNRRWGVKTEVTYPFLSAELAIDLRFGLFERRTAGHWWPL